MISVTTAELTLRFKHGAQWRFSTNTGRLIAIIDSHGNQLTLTRDNPGRVVEIISPLGRKLTMSYTGLNVQIDRIHDSALNREISYQYDILGRLSAVTDIAGGITRL